jgi:hypothetical protein
VINPIALIETVAEFCQLVREIQEIADPTDCGVRVSIHLRSADVLHLGPGPVSQWGSFRSQARALQTKQLDLSANWVQGRIDVGKLAYQLIVQVYRNFSYEDDRVPYVVGEAAAQAIDLDFFRKGAPG